jgi:O-antigen ligase
MLKMQTERYLSRILSFGAFSVSIFILWAIVTDPVNVTKHFLLGVFATSALIVSQIFGFKQLWRDCKVAILLAALFLIFSLSAVFNSSSPSIQNFYGSFGRNTGFVAYLFLTLIFVSTLVLRRSESFESLIKSLLLAGLVNVVYCLWAWQVGDFVGWSNPFNTILGTFGNPDFIGAFLGIFASVLVAYLFSEKVKLWLRISGVAILIVTAIEIKHSHAIQGIVVAAGGIALVLFYAIRSKFKSSIPSILYAVFVSMTGVFAIAGALQEGPLSQYIYKTSVTLRGEYWNAGINMARKFPLTGVGMDTYGDWYRMMRRDSALVLPGPEVVSNAAHNVNIDILASGGWPLFIAYLALIAITIISILKATFRSKNYDWVLVSLTVGWVCYQVQALISINQIGLAIWGWLFSGAIIAYEISTREKIETKNSNSIPSTSYKAGYQGENLSPQLLASIGLVIGGLLAVPPLSADMKWSAAVKSGKVANVEAALKPGYLNPPNVYKYLQAAQLFEANKLPDLAYKYSKIAVDFNPNNFDSWKLFYYISKSSSADKDLALQNMRRLDPKNNKILDRPTS